jgi:hypothetical protein
MEKEACQVLRHAVLLAVGLECATRAVLQDQLQVVWRQAHLHNMHVNVKCIRQCLQESPFQELLCAVDPHPQAEPKESVPPL